MSPENFSQNKKVFHQYKLISDFALNRTKTLFIYLFIYFITSLLGFTTVNVNKISKCAMTKEKRRHEITWY